MTHDHLKPTGRTLPADLVEHALLDITVVRAAVCMSVSWIHDEVRHGRFPAPVVRQPRCTRWRASDIKAYLIERATQTSTDVAHSVTARAKKASDAAKAKRSKSVTVVAVEMRRTP